MARINFDLDVLRTFVTGIELGSFARAADRLGRSTSAVSAQLKKLEEQAGTPVLRREGRGMALTEAGETLLAYARRLLELNDEAAGALRGGSLEGRVRLGLQEDFGETLLPAVLARFARAHPKVRIEVRTSRNQQLIEGVRSGELDLALAWETGERTPYMERWGEWHSAGSVHRMRPCFPLPKRCRWSCWRRPACCAARQRRPWTGPACLGAWPSPVPGCPASGPPSARGWGIGLRTPIGLPVGVERLDAGRAGLPTMEPLGLCLHCSEAEPEAVVERLRELLKEGVAELLESPALR